MVSEVDRKHLRRAVELAREALAAGDAPFGSVLVSGDGEVLAEDRNREGTGDATRHPEFDLARWAANHMTQDERAKATVYTSGEHCAMCAAAHAWVGLGRIVYAVSSRQYRQWRAEMGVTGESPVRSLPIQEIAPFVKVEGPVAEFEREIHELHRRAFAQYTA
jgi:tRNA(Arg) A34 adenosine deaminase TadA